VTTADEVAAWVADRLAVLPDAVERLLLIPLLVLLTYWALRIMVGYVLRIALMTLAYWVIPVIVHAGAVSLLAVEFLTARAFRLVRVRPAGVVYGFGNTVVRSGGRLSALSRSTVDVSDRLRAFPRILLAGLAAYLVYRWGQGFCERSASSPCVSPTSAWWAEIESMASFLRR
jgi:hypothetical protein